MEFDKSKNEVELGDYIDHIKGNAFKSRDMNKNNDVPVIKVKNFTADSIEIDTSDLLPKSFVVEYERYLLKENDILISTVGSWPSNPESVVGKVVRVPNLKKKLLLNQNIVKVFSTSQYLDNSFLFWVLKSENFKQFIISKAQGSANQASITLKSIDTYTFELPSIEEQREISEFLNNIQNKIELNNQMIATLEELAATLFKRWFVDFEFPDENGNPYKSSGGKMVDSELGEIPEGWEVSDIGTISKKVITGKTPSTKQIENYGGNIPFITIPDMHGKSIVTETSRYLSEKGINRGKLLPKESICVSCIATPGLVAMNNYESQTNQQINSIIPHDIDKYILLLDLKSKAGLIRELGSGGSTTLNLNKSQFEKISILDANDSVKILFNKYIEPLYSGILELQLQIKSLNKIRDELLPRLLNGNIEIFH